MIPQVAKRGTSFKGAGLYYLHDKRLEGETEKLTSERVAWTETRNLMTDDAEFSLRIMAATAMDKDRLKEAAGISELEGVGSARSPSRHRGASRRTASTHPYYREYGSP